MPSSAETLVEELVHIATQAGGRPLERLLADTAVWFYKNHKHIPRENLLAKLAFHEKALWCMVEINALLAERLHKLEAGQKGAANLWLPRGMKVNGQAHEFE
jgi:hypothetical protein